MGKQVKTSKGVFIDIDALRMQSSSATAIGNMRVNGRGDRIDSKKNVTESIEDRARAFNRSIARMEHTVSITDESDTDSTPVESISQNMPNTKSKAVEPKKTISKSREVELEDGSIQIIEDE